MLLPMTFGEVFSPILQATLMSVRSLLPLIVLVTKREKERATTKGERKEEQGGK